MTNKKDYSLLLVNATSNVNEVVSKLVEENNDILNLEFINPLKLIIKDKYSKFTYTLFDPIQNNDNKIIYKLLKTPKNYHSEKPHQTYVESKNVSANLSIWIGLIRNYNSIKWTPEEKKLHEYEQEFYDDFEIIDEDADFTYYDLDKQVVINNYFVNVIKLLKENESKYIELIKEAEEIKEEIPKMTKKTTVKRISRFLAKVRVVSLSLLKQIFEIGKKEIFERGVILVLDNMKNLYDLPQ